jgi:hypothetical protein
VKDLANHASEKKTPSPQARNPAEYQHILESSGRRLQWVLDHPDTYRRRPVAFVPAGTGFRMASVELHPEVIAPWFSGFNAHTVVKIVTC